jgi:hypothetical protein
VIAHYTLPHYLNRTGDVTYSTGVIYARGAYYYREYRTAQLTLDGDEDHGRHFGFGHIDVKLRAYVCRVRPLLVRVRPRPRPREPRATARGRRPVRSRPGRHRMRRL